MNTTQSWYPASPQVRQLKASDADRDAVLAALSEHFQAGRLTSEELEERTGRALAARTYGELDDLTADLPAPPASQQLATQQATAPPDIHWRLAPAPLIAAIAAVALISAVVGIGSGYGRWSIWWIVPVALLFARRQARRRECMRSEGSWTGGQDRT